MAIQTMRELGYTVPQLDVATQDFATKDFATKERPWLATNN